MNWRLSLFGAALLLPLGVSSLPLVLNHSDSVPLGFYRTSRDERNQYVGFCLDVAVLKRAQREGLRLPSGDCPGGVTPILKPFVRASPERPVAFTREGFVVDGSLLPNTVPKERSQTGVHLEHYPFGTYTSGLWVISKFNANSYDSRYIGPVKASQVRFYARPLWTW